MAHNSHSRLHALHRHFHSLKDAAGNAPIATGYKSSLMELVRREIDFTGGSDSSDSSSSSGSSGSSGSSSSSSDAPEAPSGPSASTVAISVSIVVPVVIALVLFIVLHRRHKKKLRLEELNDPHKSLDFGVDPALMASRRKKSKKGGQPEMTSNENLAKSLHGRGGMSADIGGSPYFLPPDMHHSKESLSSLTRSLGHGNEDPYRPATNFSDRANTPSIRGDDAASIRTHSTARTGRVARQDPMSQNLLRNAQRMSTSGPPPPASSLPDVQEEHKDTPPLPINTSGPIARKDLPPPPAQTSPIELDAGPQSPPGLALSPPVPNPDEVRQSTISQSNVRQSNNYLASFIHSREASIEGSSRGQSPQPHAVSPPARNQSLKSSPIPQISIEQEFPGAKLSGDNEIVVPPAPDAASREKGGTGGSDAAATPDIDVSTPFYTPTETVAENPTGLGVDLGASNRLSILRPLPPEDPTDTAEQRANRIRSFYKEYFSEGDAKAFHAGEDYYEEDYGTEFLADATVFDPATGQFVVAQAPWAEPVMRRAMTPPPRGPPRRFQGGPGRSSGGPGPMPPRGRAFSSASTGRVGPGARPQKRLPPPKALRTLPTPHLLKEDAFVLPIDFAPPTSIKERTAGRSDSPFMESRPFSPSVPIANTLASAMNELPVMPSPHMLRKSGTFTALDFAPPPKFKNEGGSDAASMRSGRSGHSARSAAQVHNIRAGAYRVSRIPKGLVGTQKELEQSLKPDWNLGYK